MTKQKPRRVFRLSDQEAQVLQTIFRAIGGDPTTSSRKVVDALGVRLEQTFGFMSGLPTDGGSIYFKDLVNRGR